MVPGRKVRKLIKAARHSEYRNGRPIRFQESHQWQILVLLFSYACDA